MNNIFRQIVRALYQIIVVGIILLPIRLAMFIIQLLLGLMTVVAGKDAFVGYYSGLFLGIGIAYRVRATWVKYGQTDYELKLW